MVAAWVNGQERGEVVMALGVKGAHALFIGLSSVPFDIIVRNERLIASREARVVLGGTSVQQENGQE